MSNYDVILQISHNFSSFTETVLKYPIIGMFTDFSSFILSLSKMLALMSLLSNLLKNHEI